MEIIIRTVDQKKKIEFILDLSSLFLCHRYHHNRLDVEAALDRKSKYPLPQNDQRNQIHITEKVVGTHLIAAMRKSGEQLHSHEPHPGQTLLE